jgi:hypothetical protein
MDAITMPITLMRTDPHTQVPVRRLGAKAEI